MAVMGIPLLPVRARNAPHQNKPALDPGPCTAYVPVNAPVLEFAMKKLILVCALLLGILPATESTAGPWTALEPVRLLASDTSATLPVGEKLGKIDNLRFRIDGATVMFESLTLIPVEGEPIELRAPVQLKSGESSGLINIPGMATVIDKLKLVYRITDGKPATMTLRIKRD